MTRVDVTTVKLPVYNERGEFKLFESLDCTDRGHGILELVHSPGLAEGLAAGDQITLQSAKPGYNIVRRSGNLCLWFFTGTDSVERDREQAAPDVVRDVKALGGYLDGGTSASLVFTVPIQAGFASVARVFDDAVARHPGSVWLYGNVYDPIDGETPLNWWL
jgi:Domain of unknown function (DUF4265)